MTGNSGSLTPAEEERRAVAIKTANKIVIKLGFRRVAGRVGWWYHPELGQERTFDLTVSHRPVENAGEVLCHVFDKGVHAERARVGKLIRELMGA